MNDVILRHFWVWFGCVTANKHEIGKMVFFEILFGKAIELRDSFDRTDATAAADDRGEKRSSPSGASTNIKNTIPGFWLQKLEHKCNRQRL